MSDSSSDDEATILAPLIPLRLFEPNGFEVEVSSEKPYPLCSSAPIAVFCPSGVEGAAQNVLPQTTGPNVPPPSIIDKNEDTTFLLDNAGSGSLGDLNSFAENSFHSLHSDSSIVKHIEQMGMDPSRPVILSS